MKLYTTFTPSHRQMYDEYFLPTLNGSDNFELVSVEIPQECVTGKFYEEGWSLTCFRKVELFVDACRQNMGDIFVYSDVDIQFFGPIKDVLIEELGEYDMAVQNDTAHYYCSGFFICRANERTLAMFEAMRDNYQSEDQTTLNRHIHLCRSKFLSKRFFTIAHLTGTVWDGSELPIPSDILMHHANWTSGVDNKIKMMEMVKKKINSYG